MWSIGFWKLAVERAVKTFAQTFIAVLGGGAVNVVDADLGAAVGVSAGAALLSVLTSLASAKITNGDPSLV